MTAFEDCLKKELIRKNEKAKKWVNGSLQVSEKFIDSAVRTLEIQEFEMSIIAAYNSIFHSSRALLFSKGFIEKSHYCLFIAVKELYCQDKEVLEFLNSAEKARLSRQNIQYLGSTAGKDEAEFVLELAENLLRKTKGLAKNA